MRPAERLMLADLERAELASRARRLAAAADADARVARARERADRILATGDRAVRRAVRAQRARHEAAADAAIGAIERELERLEDAARGGAEHDSGFEAAVALVVAAVLGEPGG
jgi:hypothetical protein